MNLKDIPEAGPVPTASTQDSDVRPRQTARKSTGGKAPRKQVGFET